MRRQPSARRPRIAAGSHPGPGEVAWRTHGLHPPEGRGVGVSRIVPNTSQRSVVACRPIVGARTEHWAKVVQGGPNSAGAHASPGSCRSRRWTSGCPVSCPGSSCSSSSQRARAGFPSAPPRSFVTLLIGPEGGFAAEEATAAERAGYRALRLGPRVLRTETASA